MYLLSIRAAHLLQKTTGHLSGLLAIVHVFLHSKSPQTSQQVHCTIVLSKAPYQYLCTQEQSSKIMLSILNEGHHMKACCNHLPHDERLVLPGVETHARACCLNHLVGLQEISGLAAHDQACAHQDQRATMAVCTPNVNGACAFPLLQCPLHALVNLLDGWTCTS